MECEEERENGDINETGEEAQANAGAGAAFLRKFSHRKKIEREQKIK